MAEGMAKGGSSGGAATELAVGMAIAQQIIQQQGVPGAPAAGAAAAGGAAAAAPPAGAGIPELMNPADVAKVLGVTEADVISTIEAGDLKAKKIGTAYRVTRAALDEFLKH